MIFSTFEAQDDSNLDPNHPCGYILPATMFTALVTFATTL
jgi:hypothetical protein